MPLLDPESGFWDLTRAEVAGMAAVARQDRDDDIAPLSAERRAASVRLDRLMRASRARRVRDLSAIGEVTRLGQALGYLAIPAKPTGHRGDQ